MKRAIAMALIASTLLAGHSVAFASEAQKGHDNQTDPGAARSMDAPYLAVPVVRNGQLVNYLFVSIRIEIQPGVDLWRTRERAQFVRDALVRAAHANQLADANDPNLLDQAHAIAVFRNAAMSVLGPQTVGRVIIVSSYSSRGSG